MNGDGRAQLAFLLLAITLPMAALMSRRLPAGTLLRMALLWAAIILATLAMVAGVRMMLERTRHTDPAPGRATSSSIHFT